MKSELKLDEYYWIDLHVCTLRGWFSYFNDSMTLEKYYEDQLDDLLSVGTKPTGRCLGDFVGNMIVGLNFGYSQDIRDEFQLNAARGSVQTIVSVASVVMMAKGLAAGISKFTSGRMATFNLIEESMINYRRSSKTGMGKSISMQSGISQNPQLKIGDYLPDDLEIVVIGSNNKPNNFMLREGIDNMAIGDVSVPGKSASIATDLSLKMEINKMFGRLPKRGDTLSAAFVEDIRAAGFEVVYAPTPKNPYHVRIVSKSSTFNQIGREQLALAFDRIARQKK